MNGGAEEMMAEIAAEKKAKGLPVELPFDATEDDTDDE